MKKTLTNLTLLGALLLCLSTAAKAATESSGDTHQNGVVRNSSNLKFVVISDTQYPWTARTDNHDPSESESEKKTESARVIRAQASDLTSYRMSNGGLDTVPLFINGDITAFGHGWQRSFMYLSAPSTPFATYGRNFYAGLGNHDYQNNVNDCANNGCARDMVQDMVGWVRGYGVGSFDHHQDSGGVFDPIVHTGSLAYSKLFGDFLMIQLQNEPTYENYFESGIPVLDKKIFNITNSLDWLERELVWAKSNGKAVILHMHKPPFSGWSGDNAKKARFTQLLRSYPVVAIFAGHLHNIVGRHGVIEGVPVFLSGSSSQETYLIAEYTASERKLRVYAVRRAGHQQKELVGTITVPPPSSDDFSDASIVLYEGDNGSQDVVCTIKLDRSQAFNFGGSSGCANDEVRSGKLMKARAGTEIQFYGNWNANTCNQGCSTIYVQQNVLTPITIPSVENNWSDPAGRIRVVRSGGSQQLAGKISSMRISLP